ncbi:TlpA family protein disulfide reductase [Paenibacillus rhizoplanae]
MPPFTIVWGWDEAAPDRYSADYCRCLCCRNRGLSSAVQPTSGWENDRRCFGSGVRSGNLAGGRRCASANTRGRVVLLNFWATWCKPCMREMPLLNELSQSAELPVETLFVNAGESKGTVSEYMAEQQFTFPVIIDVTGRISASYSVNALPSTYIINKAGEISKVVVGEIGDLDTLKQWLVEAGAE